MIKYILLSLLIAQSSTVFAAVKCKNMTLEGQFEQENNETYFKVNAKAESEFILNIKKSKSWYYEIEVKYLKACEKFCEVELVNIVNGYDDIEYQVKPFSMMEFKNQSFQCFPKK
jgi:hypothetical protein